jgi:NADH:ubiquinone oxidoreductase subunit 5 (subunit L)/multisubunit Na+/H+ antiporter MnhA subunit
MEAPVPASALIHSATLVSAGVFLLLRFSVFFEYTYVCNLLIPFLGALTAFTGSFLACFQSDIKKILAYSTISHCGFLFYLVNTSVIEFTLFYLFAHGFFKAASFMCIGNVLRFSKGYQDFRRMGGFWKYLPFEYFFTFICLANLAGLPFTLGFFSKHLVLYSVEYSTFYFYINYYFINISSILGLLYSFRLFWFTFLDFKKGRKSIYKLNNNESLFSKYYTNSSLASIIAITSLVTLSYVILILFYIELVKNNYLTMDVNLNINNINYNHVIKQDMVKKINLSFLNFFLFFIFFFFFYIDWRKTYYYKSKIVTFFEFVIIITCLFFFKTFL